MLTLQDAKNRLSAVVDAALRRADRAPAENDLHLSVISLGEIERGIRLQDRRNPEVAADLRRWLDRTVSIFSDRVLAFTARDALVCEELSARIGSPGAGLMIAARAIARDATVVTGNVADFAPTGARVLDPF